MKIITLLLTFFILIGCSNNRENLNKNSKGEKNVEKIKEVIEIYAKGSREGDVDLLKTVFAKNAIMSGNLKTVQLVASSPEIFFNDINGKKSVDYTHRISGISKSDNVAIASLEEKGLGGKSFVNHFHLIKIDGQWKIVSKLFEEIEE